MDTGRKHIVRAQRQPYDGKAEGNVGDRPFEGRVANISTSGALLEAPAGWSLTDNDAFVNLHIAGLGNVRGQVARRADDGFAVEFDERGEDIAAIHKRLEASLGKQ